MLFQSDYPMEHLLLNSISSSHKVPDKGKEEISWKEGK
jgi:hypothetical protein